VVFRVGRLRHALSFACAITRGAPALAPSPQPSRLGHLLLGHGNPRFGGADPTPITGSCHLRTGSHDNRNQRCTWPRNVRLFGAVEHAAPPLLPGRRQRDNGRRVAERRQREDPKCSRVVLTRVPTWPASCRARCLTAGRNGAFMIRSTHVAYA